MPGSAKLLLNLFLVCSFCIGGSHAILSYVGVIPLTVFALLQIFSLIILAWATKVVTNTMGVIPRTNSYVGHLTLLGIMLIAMFIRGIVRGNSTLIIADEGWVFGVMFFFLILGRYDEVWQALEKPMYIYFCLAFVLVLASLSRPGGQAVWGYAELGASGGKDVRQASSLAYDIRGLLKFWPILFVMSYNRKGASIWRLIGLCTPMMILLLQVFTFKFRSEVGLCLVQVAIVVCMLPIIRKRLKIGTVILMGMSLVICYHVVKGTADFEFFTQRFEEGDKFSFRRVEIDSMVSEMGIPDLVIGKGLGGWFRPPFGTALHWTRTELHVGLAFLLLKGGGVFFLLFIMLLLRVFLRKPPGWYDNPHNLVAISVLPVFALAQIGLPFPTTALHLEIIVAALVIARMGTPVRYDYAEFEFSDEIEDWELQDQDYVLANDYA